MAVAGVDALILTALEEELRALVDEAREGADAIAWEARRDRQGFPYYVAQLHTGLRVAAAWSGAMGEVDAALCAARLAEELAPAWLAMCGICAGRRGDVFLGDVVVADRVYSYDQGKQGSDEIFYHDIRTYNLDGVWKVDAQAFGRDLSWLGGHLSGRPPSKDAQERWILHTLSAGVSPLEHLERKLRCPHWTARLAALRKRGLVVLDSEALRLTDAGAAMVREERISMPDGFEDPPFRVHVGAMATGKAVRRDAELFDHLRRLVRTTIAVEMEAAAIGHVAELFKRKSIIVKAVSDYADADKDDVFRSFACRASAQFVISFLATRSREEKGPLEEARARKRRLEELGADTREVDDEILRLRREHRSGRPLRAGDSLGQGRYLLLERLGRGGFGVVWKARDVREDREVAIKVLHAEIAADPIRRERFERGARMVAELAHPALVKVLDPGGEDDSYHFHVMELLAGGDLKNAVLEGRIASEAALEVILEVGGALAEAHAKGWVHRDVKPANILLDAELRPKLTDFDLVRAEETTGGTRTGALGTFLYAAPELMDRPQDADARADVYGLAMTAVFALYGRELPRAVIRDAVAFVDGLSCTDAVKDVLKRALPWEAADRYADAAELCHELQRAMRQWAPTWALRSGEDQYGRWAEASIGGVPSIFRFIPPGSFMMGSGDDDLEAFDDEKPPHRVTLTQGFWMAEAPCTQREWAAVMGSNPSYFKGDDRPVEQVSWEDVGDFLVCLDRVFRLPSEAEWEYACRAGSEAPRCGDLDAIAWHWGSGGTSTYPIKQKEANAWGLYDILGNVSEWCADGLRTYGRDAIDPTGEVEAGAYRVVRGGSWFDQARYVRATYRDAHDPSLRDGLLGLRLVRDPGPNQDAEHGERGSRRGTRGAGRGSFTAEPRAVIASSTKTAKAEIGSIEKRRWASESGRDQFGEWTIVTAGSVRFRLRWIARCIFMMGSPVSEAGRDADEGPQHLVTLSRGYWIGDVPVTQALWTEVMKENPSRFKSPDRPVENVSWDDSQRFLEALNQRVPGLGARLPTEAEWENACRAGTTTATYAGDLQFHGPYNAQPLSTIAWYGGNCGVDFEIENGWDVSVFEDAEVSSKRGGSHPVARKEPNDWGLYDMLGNVREWCCDGMRSYYGSSTTDPVGSLKAGSVRVIRGGSWNSLARRVRAAHRNADHPSYRDYDLGLRLVRVL